MKRRSRSCASRSTTWPTAASTTSWAAASAVTRSMRSGPFRTSRKCSTTTDRCLRCTPTLRASPADRRYARRRARHRADGSCARCTRTTARSTRASMPTAKDDEGKFYVWTRERQRAPRSPARNGSCAEPYLRLRPAAELRGHVRVESARQRNRSTPSPQRSGIDALRRAARVLAGARAGLFAARRSARPARARRQDPDVVERARDRGPRARRPARSTCRDWIDLACRRRRCASLDAVASTAGSWPPVTAIAAALNAYLDDHAFLLAALIELMQTRFRRPGLRTGLANARRRAACALRGRSDAAASSSRATTTRSCSIARSRDTTTRRHRATELPRRRWSRSAISRRSRAMSRPRSVRSMCSRRMSHARPTAIPRC